MSHVVENNDGMTAKIAHYRNQLKEVTSIPAETEAKIQEIVRIVCFWCVVCFGFGWVSLRGFMGTALESICISSFSHVVCSLFTVVVGLLVKFTSITRTSTYSCRYYLFASFFRFGVLCVPTLCRRAATSIPNLVAAVIPKYSLPPIPPKVEIHPHPALPSSKNNAAQD